MPTPFTKRDRVEFDHNGQTVYGVVSRGGSKLVKVSADGAKFEYSVLPSLLRRSDVPLPKDDPHPMDAWGVKDYVRYDRMSEETVAFTATVTLDGVPVIDAKNDGQGGCNSYYSMSGGYAMVARFEEEAKKWLMDHGLPEEHCFEAGDMWLDWKANQAPYGVTARDKVERWIETLGSIHSARM